MPLGNEIRCTWTRTALIHSFLFARLLSSAQTATPNDPLWEFQWNMRKIAAPEAWNNTLGSSNVVVVVIDTGVDYTHEDLVPNIWRNPGETGVDLQGRDKSSNQIDDDQNGYVDDVHGIDLVAGDSDPMDEGFVVSGVPFPTYHGTSCAGVIGAGGNNGKGVAGLNWSISIMAIRVLWHDVDREFNQAVYDTHLIEAFKYVLKMKRAGVNIRATSNSYGSATYSPALRDAIEAVGNEGVLNVFAAGNNKLDNDDLAFYPAGYNSESILAVAASTEADELWALSNFGKSTVHIAAPGLDIPTTTRRANPYTISFNGTSAAVPHVAGAIALLAAVAPNASVAEIKAALLGSADGAQGFSGRVLCNGRLNVGRALARLSRLDSPPIVINVKPAGAVARGEPVEVVFSRAMNPTSVQSAFRITPSEPGQFMWSLDLQRLKFVSDGPMTPADHLVEISGTAKDARGVSLDGNFDGTVNNLEQESFAWKFGFPLANDDFANAQRITGGTGQIDGTTRKASPETEEPDHAKNPLSATSVWYQWVAPMDGSFIFEISESTFDTLLAIYNGTSLGSVTEVASNDDSVENRSRVTFTAKSATHYSIAVAGKARSRDKYFLDQSSFGEFRLTWRQTPASPVITDFAPTNGPAGTTVLIRGQNLDQTTNVWLGTVAVAFSIRGSDIVMTVPPNATDGLIRLSGLSGESISANTFFVLPPVLRIEHEPPSTLTLRWASTHPAIVLEHAPSIQNAFWIAITNGLIRTAVETIVQLQPTENERYYRLKK